jgi:hypothetical protein
MGLSSHWRLAGCPTIHSPVRANPTTPPSMTATTEFVVPGSTPVALAIG